MVAALVPFSETAALISHAPNVRWSDVVVVAFALPWLAGAGSPLTRRVRVDKRLSAPTLLFGATVLASCAVTIIRLEAGDLSSAVESGWVYLAQDFALVQTRTGGLPEGAALIEGLLLFWSVVALCQLNQDLPRRLSQTIVAAGVGAAILSMLVSRGIGPSPLVAQAQILSMRRVSGHVFDVNAAGSYFAMTACLALGMTAVARGRARAIWMIASGAIGYGLWLSGSRIALAAAVTTFCLPIAQLRTAWLSPVLIRRLTGLAMVLALVSYFLLRASPLSLGSGLGLRFQFVETALRMWATRPVFGVGIGGFYLLSRRFMAPELGWRYAFENAHNYFLQIAAELGIVGVALFVWVLLTIWRRIWNERSRRDPVVIGVTAGLAAFLITCLTGHPVLVHEVAYPFWMTLGLAVALVDPYIQPIEETGVTSSTRPFAQYRSLVMAAALLVILGTVPFRAQPLPNPISISGVYDWERDANGERVRWTRDYATIVVPSNATAVDLALRAPRPTGIDLAIDGTQVLVVRLDNTWRTIRIALPPAPIETPYRRVDLRAYSTPTVGARVLGVQLGDVVVSPRE
jgi:O-antigen ligase/polysaccharide polymerase Wzy-like membrane protein